jgi:hypothetical protein
VINPVSVDALFPALAMRGGRPNDIHQRARVVLELHASQTDLRALLPLVGCEVEVTFKYKPLPPLPNGHTVASLRESLNPA